jgi:hypothetical protein
MAERPANTFKHRVSRAGGAVQHLPPRVSPHRPRRALARGGRLTNPGAESAKEYGIDSLTPAPRPRRAREEPRFDRNEMTLGNGYLGSRIDEERSEMRYLV